MRVLLLCETNLSKCIFIINVERLNLLSVNYDSNSLNLIYPLETSSHQHKEFVTGNIDDKRTMSEDVCYKIKNCRVLINDIHHLAIYFN